VARLVADRLMNKEIAHELGLSIDTVRAYLRMISAKLNLGSRRDIAAWVWGE
jgi:DNA-binding CsgD family transcriptional regulator